MRSCAKPAASASSCAWSCAIWAASSALLALQRLDAGGGVDQFLAQRRRLRRQRRGFGFGIGHHRTGLGQFGLEGAQLLLAGRQAFQALAGQAWLRSMGGSGASVARLSDFRAGRGRGVTGTCTRLAAKELRRERKRRQHENGFSRSGSGVFSFGGRASQQGMAGHGGRLFKSHQRQQRGRDIGKPAIFQFGAFRRAIDDDRHIEGGVGGERFARLLDPSSVRHCRDRR